MRNEECCTPSLSLRLTHCISYVICSLSLALVVTMAFSPAQADSYPSRPVRIIVPYGAGGVADVTIRLVAKELSERFGQQFFIDNRPGARGVVGMKAARGASPDGYTLVMIGGGLTIAQSLLKSVPYDIETDFAPISTIASYGLVIATKAGSPLKTINDVIAAAKASPERLNVGTINAGSTQHLAAELFRIMAGINVKIIPFKTTPDLALAVLRGDIDVAFDYFPGLQSPIVEGRMIAIATTGRNRAKQLPNVPTVIESGLPDYDVTSWNALAAPSDTSDDIVFILNRAVAEALKSPEVQHSFNEIGIDAHGMSSKELAELIRTDVAKWSQVIEKAGIEK